MTERYLEDFTVGQTFGSGRLRIDEEQIRRFASEFDPQPFHLDEGRAPTMRPGAGERKM
jgi:acyl dehydratase